MKVWARYAVPVMVLVDEHKDEIERVVMVPGARFIDRETMGDMLLYSEQLEQISSSRPQAAHALYVGDHERWPDPAAWEIEATWDMLSMSVDERRHPSCPDWPAGSNGTGTYARPGPSISCVGCRPAVAAWCWPWWGCVEG